MLARKLKRPFIDLDHLIEVSDAGKSIVRIIGEQGEETFRDIEYEALKEAVGQDLRVRSKSIALGGGALFVKKIVRSPNVLAALFCSARTLKLYYPDFIQAPISVLCSPEICREKLTSLLAQRKERYDSFSVRIDVNRSLKISWQIQVALGRFHSPRWGNMTWLCKMVGSSSWRNAKNAWMQNPMVVTDQHVRAISHGAGTRCFPSGRSRHARRQEPQATPFEIRSKAAQVTRA